MINWILLLSSCLTLFTTERFATGRQALIISRIALSCAIFMGFYFAEPQAMNIKAFIASLSIACIGTWMIKKRNSDFLLRLLCFTPMFSSLFTDYSLLALIFNINLIYFVLLISQGIEKLKSNVWYVGFLIAISSGLSLVISQGYSSIQLLKIGEIASYFELGYINHSYLFLLTALFLSLVINPVTVRLGSDSFIARWISSVYLFAVLGALPENMNDIFLVNVKILLPFVIGWWLFHIAILKNTSNIDSLLSFVVPFVFVLEKINPICFYLFIFFYVCGFVSTEVSELLITKICTGLGVIMFAVLTLLTPLSRMAELVLIIMVVLNWINIKDNFRKSVAQS